MNVEPPKLHRLFYPQVPLILAARSGNRVSAMPVVSYMAVSEAPLLVAVGCNRAAFTYKLCVRAKAFSLSVVGLEHLEAVETLAKVRGSEVQDKLLEVGLKHVPGRRAPVPVIAGSMATIECSMHSRRTVGDHVLLVGEVKACYTAKGFGDFWDFGRYDPILYTGWKDGMTTYSQLSQAP